MNAFHFVFCHRCLNLQNVCSLLFNVNWKRSSAFAFYSFAFLLNAYFTIGIKVLLGHRDACSMVCCCWSFLFAWLFIIIWVVAFQFNSLIVVNFLLAAKEVNHLALIVLIQTSARFNNKVCFFVVLKLIIAMNAQGSLIFQTCKWYVAIAQTMHAWFAFTHQLFAAWNAKNWIFFCRLWDLFANCFIILWWLQQDHSRILIWADSLWKWIGNFYFSFFDSFFNLLEAQSLSFSLTLLRVAAWFRHNLG